jgi:hypothetical protein
MSRACRKRCHVALTIVGWAGWPGGRRVSLRARREHHTSYAIVMNRSVQEDPLRRPDPCHAFPLRMSRKSSDESHHYILYCSATIGCPRTAAPAVDFPLFPIRSVPSLLIVSPHATTQVYPQVNTSLAPSLFLQLTRRSQRSSSASKPLFHRCDPPRTDS